MQLSDKILEVKAYRISHDGVISVLITDTSCGRDLQGHVLYLELSENQCLDLSKGTEFYLINYQLDRKDWVFKAEQILNEPEYQEYLEKEE